MNRSIAAWATGAVLFAGGFAAAADWPGWLGPDRNMITPEMPGRLPAKKLLWQKPMTGETHGGIAVAGNFAIVPDYGDGKDIIRCITADKGEELWTHGYAAKADMQFTACMRATPLVYQKRVYTLGALGEFCCLDLEKAAPDKKATVVWRRNIADDYSAPVPDWGYSASPLIADGLLLVAPGAPAAAVVALDPLTGKEKWKAPGEPAAYGSFIAATLGGVRQLIGYDKAGLGGWELTSGKRLWTVTPEVEGDYNVSTPMVAGADTLLLSSENNGTRLFKFGKDGKPDPKPVVKSDVLSPGMATPVIWKGRVYGTSGGLYALDLADNLKTLWSNEDEPAFSGYAAYMAGNDRLLLFAEKGTLFLLDISAKEAKLLGSLPLCDKTWSHPALANGRFLVRDAKTLFCYDLTAK